MQRASNGVNDMEECMKKVIVLSAALAALSSSVAFADSFSLSIGEPAYVEPVPVYPAYPAYPVYPAYPYAAPGATFIIGGEHHVYPYRDRHRYDWGYWHPEHEREHDRDHDHGRR